MVFFGRVTTDSLGVTTDSSTPKIMSLSKFQSVKYATAERIVDQWISEHLKFFHNSQKPAKKKRRTKRVLDNTTRTDADGSVVQNQF